MKTAWLESASTYDGLQLRAHWILRHAGLAGDALVAFRGPCRVSEAEMADLEDLLARVAGEEKSMLLARAKVRAKGEV